MTHEEAVAIIRRDLLNGTLSEQECRDIISRMEADMMSMHAHASYDVLAYMRDEATCNAYREGLGLAATDIGERAAVSATLSDDEYRATMAARGIVAQPLKKPRGQLWQPCPVCDDEPVCLGCMRCDRHCSCAP